MIRFLLLSLVFLLIYRPEIIMAQQPVLVECGTDQYLLEQANTSPEAAKAVAEFASRAKVASENPQLRGMQQTVKVIPVVVHIMHDYTSGTNISRAKVLDGLRMLNEDFNKLNPDTALVVSPFKHLVADVQVEFRLATIDPNGNCTDGITRTYTQLTHMANNNLKSLIQWDPNKYLNIWVAGTLSSGAGAYSSFPCGNPAADGIVTRADRLGFTNSHTVSHEVGHFLGLPHTWGMGLEPVGQASNCNTDDGIADTPNTIGGSTPICNTNQIHCGNLVNIQNMMDYGGCLIMFTLGQKAVMQSSLQMPCRENLWSATNLLATGTADGFPVVACAPTADFIASKRIICQGENIQFTDLSYNATPDSTWTWAWAFAGGSPAVSTAQHPLISYHNPGIYPVTMQASNSSGTDTISRSGYIVVKATTGALQVPFAESFERSTFPEASNPVLSWDIQSATSHTWHQTNAAFADSSYSMRIRHQFIPQNQVNSLLTPNINLAGVLQPQLEIAVAYALPASNPSATDMLRVLTSDNCGQSWVLQYIKTGSALATAAATSTNSFEPLANEWRTESVALPTSSPYLMIKFESISGNGSNLYLDAVRVVDGAATGVLENVVIKGLRVFPNPAHGNATLRYQLLQESTVKLRVVSATGKVITEHSAQQQPGLHEHAIEQISGRLAAGIYLLEVYAGPQVNRIKLAIY